MRIFAIDPGYERSAVLIWLPETQTILSHSTSPNALVRNCLREWSAAKDSALAVEMIASYGMPVGREIFETCVWIGRFIEAWGNEWAYVYRRDVKLFSCNDSRAKDANVRQALIDRFGGKVKAIGSKKLPGPLYGIHGDEWAALAVALTYANRDEAIPL